jgi:hypothetical protein
MKHSKNETLAAWVKRRWGAGLLLCLLAGGCAQDEAYRQLVAQIEEDEMLTAMQQLTDAASSCTVIRPDLLDSALIRNDRYRRRLLLIAEKRLSQAQIQERDSLLRAMADRRTDWRQWQTDPARYNLSAEVKRLLSRRQFSIDERLLAIDLCLSNAVQYYQAARQNLRRPSPDRTQLAAQQQILGLRLLMEELPDSIQRASLAQEQRRQLMDRTRNARLQLKDYIAFCESIAFEHRDSLLRQ